MAIPLRFRLNTPPDIKGLENAPRILNSVLRKQLEQTGVRLRVSAQTRMREDLGHAKKSLTIEVRGGGLNLSLEVYSTLVQAFVDGLGRDPGTFPPFGPGTKLFKWAGRRLRTEGKDDAHRASVGAAHRTSKPRGISHLSRRPGLVSRNTGLRGPGYERTKRGKIRLIEKVKLTADQRASVKSRDVRRFAFLVARKIYERGIKPTGWHTKTLAANRASIERDVQRAMAQAIKTINRGGS